MVVLSTFDLGSPRMPRSPRHQSVVDTGADFCSCREFRYALWRTWDRALTPLVVIGLNPSTADESTNDATITRCVNYAARWGHGGIVMLNLFAFCATDPDNMRRASDPRGERNLEAISKHTIGRRVLCAWGAGGDYMGRGAEVHAHLRESAQRAECLCLVRTRDGHPGHPLYKRADLIPQPYDATPRTLSAERRPRAPSNRPAGRFARA